MATMNELDARAEQLYEQEVGWEGFAEAFTLEELDALETLCQYKPDFTGGRNYDDEVYDARYWVRKAQGEQEV